MSKMAICTLALLACAATVSSKEKVEKVPFHEMALGMRDAFNCGVVVEEYLHGRLKGNTEEYAKQRQTYNCQHVEAVLNTLPDQAGAAQTQ